jgi:hypothetical protein
METTASRPLHHSRSLARVDAEVRGVDGVVLARRFVQAAGCPGRHAWVSVRAGGAGEGVELEPRASFDIVPRPGWSRM